MSKTVKQRRENKQDCPKCYFILFVTGGKVKFGEMAERTALKEFIPYSS